MPVTGGIGRGRLVGIGLRFQLQGVCKDKMETTIFTAAMRFPVALHDVQTSLLARRRSHQICFEP